MGEPPLHFFLAHIFNPALNSGDTLSILIGLAGVIFLVFISAIYSGSENAFFSLSKMQIEALSEELGTRSNAIKFLLNHPKKLLATILIANTFVNIGVVLVSTFLFATVFNFEEFPLIGFFIEVIFVTFLLVLFGEVIPKVYSFQHNEKIAKSVAVFMKSSYQAFKPLVFLLEKSTTVIDKRITKRGHILSVDELTHAIDITSEKDAPKQEKSILKGVVNFGNTTVKQIMKQRMDIVAVDIQTPFDQLMLQIIDAGYSRVPVYETNLDSIKGILFTKDLLSHINEGNDFNWQGLVRKPFFIPESKKIDDLLKEFQSKRMHLALVVDEFGGTEGLVTMEDIMEEIFGEIQDEFDDEELVFTKINDHTFVFEARMLINDAIKLMEIDADEFSEIRNEAETLGGMVLEITKEIPKLGAVIAYNQFVFKIEAVDKRKIKRIKITFSPPHEAL